MDDILDIFDVDEQLELDLEKMCNPVTDNIIDWG